VISDQLSVISDQLFVISEQGYRDIEREKLTADGWWLKSWRLTA